MESSLHVCARFNVPEFRTHTDLPSKRYLMKRFILLLLAAEISFAGDTGKISGRVVDASTNEPLVGVNIVLQGTTLGAASGVDGTYFIINIPPGTYGLRASMLGYASKTVTDVRVAIDMTTTLDFRLTSSDIQLEDVVITAQMPAIQQDRTTTRHIVTDESINVLPVDNIQDVVQLQAGVSGSHFRGGRFNEALYLVDGLPLRSAVNGYTGYTGGFSIVLPQLSVAEIQVATGGFEAEYGNAQSGVISTTTRSATDALNAKIRIRTQDLPGMEVSYRPNEFGTGQPDWRNYEAFVSTPRLDVMDMTLSLSGSADIAIQNKGLLPHESLHRQAYQTKVGALSGHTRVSLSGLYSVSTYESYYHRYSKYGPLSEGYTSDLFQRIVTVSGAPLLEQYIFISDPTAYRNAPAPDSAQYLTNGTWYSNVRNIYQAGMQDHISVPTNTSYNIGLSWSQTFDERSYLDVKVSLFDTRFREIVRDVDDRDGDGDREEELHWSENAAIGGYQDRLFTDGYWYYSGDEGWYMNQVSRTISGRADYARQMDNTHLLKTGIEFAWHSGNVEKVTFESVLNRKFDVWQEDLYDFAFYVQDKIEVRDGLIVNAGIRFDYYDPNGFGESVLYPDNPADLADPARRASLTDADKADARWQISPRIGISHPITERDQIHFSYGHFFQRPDFRYLYENIKLDFRYTTNVDLGNPRLNPEKTVSYELGWTHLWSDFLRMELTGYFKDITNLVAAMDYDFVGSAEPFQAYGNVDYANVRGIELTFQTLGLQTIGGTLNYTYAFANGRSSSVFRGNGEVVPRRLDPLSWDVRHRINATIILRSTGAVHDVIGDAEASVIITAASGLPYTRNTRDVFPLFALRNDGRLPWTKNVDGRVRKTFTFASARFSLLAEVRNVFNWRNVSYIGGGREGIITFEQTGVPTGPYDIPTAYSRPRVFILGLEVQI